LSGDIFVIFRSESSGTTSIFTDYLAQIDSANWRMTSTFATKSKMAVGARGNAGVAGMIKQMPGAIGYMEIAYAMQNNMRYASVQNRSGNFIIPTLASTSAAANVDIPADTRASIVNTSVRDGYPIVGFTWVMVWQDMTHNPKGRQVVDLLKWMVTSGQVYTSELIYAPLPKSTVDKAQALINSIKVR